MTAQVDFRTFGAVERLVEDGTGEASRKIMKIFLEFVKNNGFEDKTDNVKVISTSDNIFANSYIMRNSHPYAKINIKDSKEHGSFYIIVSAQRFAEIILEHRDYIEKTLFGNNKVRIVDYEKEPLSSGEIWFEFTALCDTRWAVNDFFGSKNYKGYPIEPLSPSGYTNEEIIEMVKDTIMLHKISAYQGGSEGHVIPSLVKDQMSPLDYAEFSAMYSKETSKNYSPYEASGL